MKRLVKGALSIYERVEKMQEKAPEKISGEFTLNPKSCLNIPNYAYSPEEHKIRIMLSVDDE